MVNISIKQHGRQASHRPHGLNNGVVAKKELLIHSHVLAEFFCATEHRATECFCHAVLRREVDDQ